MKIQDFTICPMTLSTTCIIGDTVIQGVFLQRIPQPKGYVLVIEVPEGPPLKLFEEVTKTGRKPVKYKRT